MTASGASRTVAGVGRDRRVRPGPGERRGDGAEVAGAVVGEHDLSRDALRRPDAAVARRDRLPERLAERLEGGLGDVVVVGSGRFDVDGAARLHREPLEGVREQRQREAADALAVNASEISACGRRTRSTAAMARASSIGTTAEP